MWRSVTPRAIFELGVEAGQVVALSEQVRSFADTYAASRELQAVLDNPMVELEKRQALLVDVAGKVGLSGVGPERDPNARRSQSPRLTAGNRAPFGLAGGRQGRRGARRGDLCRTSAGVLLRAADDRARERNLAQGRHRSPARSLADRRCRHPHRRQHDRRVPSKAASPKSNGNCPACNSSGEFSVGGFASAPLSESAAPHGQFRPDPEANAASASKNKTRKLPRK